MLSLSLLLRNICALPTQRRAVCCKELSGSVCSSHWSTGPLFKLDLVAHKKKPLPSLKFLQAWLNDWRYRQRYSEEVSGQPCDRMHFLWVSVCVFCKNPSLFLTSAWSKLDTVLLEAVEDLVDSRCGAHQMVLATRCDMYLNTNWKSSVYATCSGITRRAGQPGSNCDCRGVVGLAVMTRQENKYWATNRVEDYVRGVVFSDNCEKLLLK